MLFALNILSKQKMNRSLAGHLHLILLSGLMSFFVLFALFVLFVFTHINVIIFGSSLL